MRQVVKTERAPKAVGTYSQGICANGFVFASGQLGIDPVSGALERGDFAKEAERVVENLKEVLEAGGSSLADIVKLTVFLSDLSNFGALNAVFARFFVSEPPARSTVQVAALPLGARVEVEAIGRIH